LDLLTHIPNIPDLSDEKKQYRVAGKSNFRHYWWPLVREDTLLLHVMLHVTAFELEWLKGSPNGFHSEVYAMENIMILRNRVQDPMVGSSDQTITAVATLASFEVRTRRLFQWVITNKFLLILSTQKRIC